MNRGVAGLCCSKLRRTLHPSFLPPDGRRVEALQLPVDTWRVRTLASQETRLWTARLALASSFGKPVATNRGARRAVAPDRP